jgi:membrane-bound lytic murein transglycosylase D
MKEFSFNIFLLCCFIILSTSTKAQTNTHSINLAETPIASSLNSDSLLYVERLDSLKSEMSLVYNPQVQKYITIYTGGRKKEFSSMLEQSQYYFPIFEKALKSYQIPLIFKYLPIIESAMNALAVSKTGATGLWQFTYETGKSYRLVIDEYVDERKDPIQASYAAAKYIREAYNDLGDWTLALAAYNCGTGAVKRAIVKAGGIRNYWQLQPYLPLETQKYVPAFIAATYVMSYPDYHNICATENGVCKQTDSIYVKSFINLNELCNTLNLQPNQLCNLNPCYKKGIVNGTVENPKRLIIPQLKSGMYASLYNELNKAQVPEIKIEKVAIAEPVIEPVVLENTVKNPSRLTYKTTVPTTEYQNNSITNSSLSYINYTVKMGDTLFGIAKRFQGLTVDKIKEINQLSTSILTIGSILKLVTINY